MSAANIRVIFDYNGVNDRISSITIIPTTQEEIEALKAYWKNGEIIIEKNKLLIVNQNKKILKDLNREETEAIRIFFEGGTRFPKENMRYSYARNDAYELFIKKYD